MPTKTPKKRNTTARLVPRPTVQPGVITWQARPKTVSPYNKPEIFGTLTESEESKDPTIARDVTMFLAGGLTAWLGAFLAYFLGA